MAFDWCEYLKLARWLQTNTPPGTSDECARRTAVGRAYYAAFGYAFQHAVDYLGYDPKNSSDDHGRLRAHLKTRKRYETSQSLDRLREWRNSCDYDAANPSDLGALDRMLASAIQDAEYVLRSLPPPAAASGL